MSHEPLHRKPEHVEAPQAAPKPKPKFRTGDIYVDEGPRCERADSDGVCFLDPVQRARLLGKTEHDGGLCLSNYRDALNDAGVDLLLQKGTGWNVIGEIAFNVVSATLLTGWGFVAAKLAREIVARGAWATESLQGLDVAKAIDMRKGWLTSVGSAVVSTAKGRLSQILATYPPMTALKVEFVRVLKNSAGVAWTTLYKQLCEQGDDVALLLVNGALDPEKLTVDFYADQVQAALDRLSSSHLDEIGPTRTGPVRDGTRQVVRFTSGGRSRLAIVEDRDRVKLGSSHGDDWYTNGGLSLVSWVDRDFEQVAERIQHERFGTVREVDVSGDDPLAQLPEVQTWARDPWSV